MAMSIRVFVFYALKINLNLVRYLDLVSALIIVYNSTVKGIKIPFQ
jgi:hypothetical protein